MDSSKRLQARTILILALGIAGVSGTAPAGETYDWGIVRCESELPIEAAEMLREELILVRGCLAADSGLEFDDRRLEIRLFKDRREYIRQISPIVPDARRQRGVYVTRDGEVGVYSFQQPDLSTVLRHESVHAWLHAALPYVPLWLDEGLASYYEVEGGAGGEAHPFESRVRWSLRLGWKPKLTALEGIRQSSDMDVGDYRHAWAWVDFLLNESDESREVLAGYLGGIAAEQPPQRLSEVLAEKLPDAESRLVRYFSRGDR